MGMDFLSVGYTIKPGATIDHTEDIEAVIATHIEALMAKIDLIDGSGLIEMRTEDFLAEDDSEEPDEDAATRKALSAVLASGYEAFWDDRRTSNGYTFTAQDGTERLFTIQGGGSWGDDPFEGFSELCILVDATIEVPEFGQAVGILGGGIVTE